MIGSITVRLARTVAPRCNPRAPATPEETPAWSTGCAGPDIKLYSRPLFAFSTGHYAMQPLIDKIQSEQMKKETAKFHVGDSVASTPA